MSLANQIIREFSGTTKEEDANIVRSYIDASQIRPDTPPPEHNN